MSSGLALVREPEESVVARLIRLSALGPRDRLLVSGAVAPVDVSALMRARPGGLALLRADGAYPCPEPASALWILGPGDLAAAMPRIQRLLRCLEPGGRLFLALEAGQSGAQAASLLLRLGLGQVSEVAGPGGSVLASARRPLLRARAA